MAETLNDMFWQHYLDRTQQEYTRKEGYGREGTVTTENSVSLCNPPKKKQQPQIHPGKKPDLAEPPFLVAVLLRDRVHAACMQ